jgi:hypothetical protein
MTGGVMVVAIDRTSGKVPVGVTQGSIIRAVGGRVIGDVKDLLQVLNDVPAERCSIQLEERQGTVASTAQ